jgi:hypothetical protein
MEAMPDRGLFLPESGHEGGDRNPRVAAIRLRFCQRLWESMRSALDAGLKAEAVWIKLLVDRRTQG